MSELTVTLLRLGYLALLWALVLFSIGVLRRDLYGTKIVDRRRTAQAGSGPGAGGTAGAAAAGAGTPGPADAAGTVKGRRTNDPTRLVVTEGPLRGTTLPLGASGILIGRAPSCTLVLDD